MPPNTHTSISPIGDILDLLRPSILISGDGTKNIKLYNNSVTTK